MVGVGALTSGLLNFLFLLANVASLPRLLILQDPIGFAIRPRVQPMAVVAMLLALVILAGLTWLFVRMIVRSALPGRAAAVFFGTWGAVIIAAWIAGLVRTPLVLMSLRIPAEQSEILMTQFSQISVAGASWGLMWGWLTALVVAVIHRSATGALSSVDPLTPRSASPSSPASAQPAPYPPTTYPPAPQPPTAG
jgi:energy-converting hydrogenase Eha subunit A